jgi:DNA modification methylase
VLLVGDCVEQMRTLEANSVDAIVTDPPYGLEFMGKAWDGFGTPLGFQTWSEQWAREALRVLKPGGHLLAFGGTRMYHRLAAGIEDAGFEIRDTLMWLYGSGFPKSLDVSKAIDKMDAKDEQQARRYRFTEWVRSTGATAQQIDKATGTAMGSHYTTFASQPAVMTREHLEACRHLLGEIPKWVERECDIRSVESKNFEAREVTGVHASGAPAAQWMANYGLSADINPKDKKDKGFTEAAKKWQGWGTALKPAVEPIVLARKPLIGTVAENVLTHGTGALNIDASRIDYLSEDDKGNPNRFKNAWSSGGSNDGWKSEAHKSYTPVPVGSNGGRWPANILLDEEAAAMLDGQSGESTSMQTEVNRKPSESPFLASAWRRRQSHGDTGGASRFFYVAKASSSERNFGLGQNIHPTVKPVDLMRYLITLVTPKGGTVLDPFLGSGTTAVAAIEEGVSWIGCEREPEYVAIIEARIAAAQPGMGLNLEEDTK